jgi:hypothetical protein
MQNQRVLTRRVRCGSGISYCGGLPRKPSKASNCILAITAASKAGISRLKSAQEVQSMA